MKTQVNVRLSEKSKNQLAELQRKLTESLGTNISQSQAIEAAIDHLLQSMARNREQGRLI